MECHSGYFYPNCHVPYDQTPTLGTAPKFSELFLKGVKGWSSPPAGLDLAKVGQAIRGVQGVLDTHDLHVWTVSSGLVASSCHIVVADQRVSGSQHIRQAVAQLLEHAFNISHSTIQVEAEDCGGHGHTAHSPHAHHHGHTH
jgi:hypothetical protein